MLLAKAKRVELMLGKKHEFLGEGEAMEMSF